MIGWIIFLSGFLFGVGMITGICSTIWLATLFEKKDGEE